MAVTQGPLSASSSLQTAGVKVYSSLFLVSQQMILALESRGSSSMLIGANPHVEINSGDASDAQVRSLNEMQHDRICQVD